MARRKKVGDVYRVDFHEKYHCYCQIVEAGDVAFFNYYSETENDNIDEILEKDEVFRIWLDSDCLKSEKWKFICNKPLPEERKNILYKYNNPVGSDDYFIFKNVVNAEFIKVPREQCFGLEVAASWMELGVVDRLNYSFFGIPLPAGICKDVPFYE